MFRSFSFIHLSLLYSYPPFLFLFYCYHHYSYIIILLVYSSIPVILFYRCLPFLFLSYYSTPTFVLYSYLPLLFLFLIYSMTPIPSSLLKRLISTASPFLFSVPTTQSHVTLVGLLYPLYLYFRQWRNLRFSSFPLR